MVFEGGDNDIITKATPIPLTEDPSGSGFFTGRGIGSINPPGRYSAWDGDIDYWSFTAQAGDIVSIAVDTLGSGLNPYVWLRNEGDGNLTSDDNVGPGIDALISHYVIESSGVYYVRVGKSYYSRDPGSYQVRIDLARGIQMESDREYSNDSTTGANVLTLSPVGTHRQATVAGNIMEAQGGYVDEDYFNLGTINVDETIFLNAKLPSVSELIPVVEVRDINSTVIAVDPDPSDSVAQVNITETGGYYAVVVAWGGAGTKGQYLLDMSIWPTGEVNFADIHPFEINVPGSAETGQKITVSWKVTNIGNGTTDVNEWHDKIVISKDEEYGNPDDRTLDSIVHTGALNKGDFYTVTTDITIPDCMDSGDYYIYIQTDSSHSVFEYIFEANNIAHATDPIHISKIPYADLIVKDVDVSSIGIAGQLLDISWTVLNSGMGSTTATTWDDQIVISTNTVYGDSDDTEIGKVLHTGELPSDQSYTVDNTNLNIPSGVSGTYYAFVVTDLNNSVIECDKENNNINYDPIPINISPTPFADLEPSNLIAPSAAQSGQTILVSWTVTNSLNALSATDNNQWWDEIFLSPNDNLGDADDINLAHFLHTGSLSIGESYSQENQSVKIPDNLSGQYYLFIRTDTYNQVYEFIYENNNTISTLIQLTDEIGPRVTAHTPDGLQTTSISQVELTFSEPINQSTFTSNDVQIGLLNASSSGHFVPYGQFESGSLVGWTVSSIDGLGNPILQGVSIIQEGDPGPSSQTDLSGLDYFGNSALCLQSPEESSEQTDQAVVTSSPFIAGNKLEFSYVDESFYSGEGRVFTAELLDNLGNSLTGLISIPANPLPSLSPQASTEGEFFDSFTINYKDYGIETGKQLRIRLTQYATQADGIPYYTIIDEIKNIAVDDPIEPISIIPVNQTRFRIIFPTQSANGVYQILIWPAIEDLAGNMLDQDQDGIMSEAEDDIYTANLGVVAERSAQVYIDARSDWVDTGVYAESGQTIRVIATGRATSAIGTHPFVGPDGAGFNTLSSTSEQFPVQGVSDWSLVGKLSPGGVFLDDGQDGIPIGGNGIYGPGFIGSDFMGIAPASGWIYLAFNDDINRLYDNAGGFNAAILILPFSETGARIITHSPSDNQPPPVDSVYVTFDQVIDTPSFTTSDVTISGPKGSIAPLGISHVMGNKYRIYFAAQSEPGEYHIYVNPTILDTEGNLMDQDQDGIPGELEDDRYDAAFSIPYDDIPPEDVTNLWAQSFDTRLVFSWDHSADTYGDMAGYKIYFNNATEGVPVGPSQNTYEITGLIPATTYSFRITAYDIYGNESSGVSIMAVTLLDNPTNISVSAYSGMVHLTWSGVEPAEYVKHYSIYTSQTEFTSVEDMTARLNVTGMAANLAGLANGVTYYFAVTTVNIFDGERKEVTPVSAMPQADTQGPEISDIRLNGAPLVDGAILTDSGTLTLDATDPSGMSRVEFYIDSNLYYTDRNGSNHYACLLNIVFLEDGSHALTITAFDTLGNSTSINYSLVVALDPPPVPTITEPPEGTLTNNPTIMIKGSAQKYTEIILYNNGIEIGSPTPVNENGDFTIQLTLSEGENRIQAAASNRAGASPKSEEILVTLDTSIPKSPTHFSAQAKPGGIIRLAWQRPLDTSIKGYHLYRATSSFCSQSQATRVNTNLILGTSFNDLTPEDGIYYYRISTVDSADNESELSKEAFAQSDNTPPRAVSIQYTPTGPYDLVTGRMAHGQVDIMLTVSEQLQAMPFLSITPYQGIPISVELTKMSELEYAGFFMISETTPSGTAYAVFSGRDMVGNRGTEIDSGSAIEIDTDGPAITQIAIQPGDPVRNDESNPVSIIVTIGLNEAIKPGEVPALSYILSAAGRSPVAIAPMIMLSAQPEHAETWQGAFQLPADAGLAEAEILSFEYSGLDDLDNISTRILCNNQFQVYQGGLPPLAPPDGLSGQSLPGGKIKLSWNMVKGAIGYQLYRQVPGESELTAYEGLGAGLEFVDEPLSDGIYIYAVSSVRQENEQESESAMSDPVEVTSDAIAPNPPQNLALELIGAGIKAQWEAPSDIGPVTYSLYRSDLLEITSVEGIEPIITGITETEAIDSHPSTADHCYVVTAMDAAGNESLPSNSFYLNFELIPISSLHVLQKDLDPPIISWTHPEGSIAGYDLYIGPEENMLKINQIMLTELSYTDTGFTGGERRYTVVAVNDNGVESVGRSITLPETDATLPDEEQIRRGVMNRLEYQVENFSSSPVYHMRLKVQVGAYDHASEKFSIDTGAALSVPVVVGGYADLLDVESLITTIEITPHTGEKVEIIRSQDIEVATGMMAVQILNEAFVRGGTGNVQFILENTGEEEIEIITATSSGASASNEIILYLLDPDGNVLSSTPYRQNLGDGVITLANGNTVARIPAGSLFTSEPAELQVPMISPYEVTIQLDFAKIYYHHGKPDQVTMEGISSRYQIVLVDTSYYGEVLTISPESSRGDQEIIITGRAVDRNTDLPIPTVPLNLVISVSGFERTYPIFTDEDGAFSFTFTPLPGESGLYSVRATHPEVFDRPVQGQFVINRISINPQAINLNIPRNYEKMISIQIAAGEGTQVNNLRLAYDALDQPEGAFPEGAHVTIGSPVAVLNSEQAASLDFTIWADNTAEETGRIVLKVKSDETGEDSWGSVMINTYFSEAHPLLYFSPDHVEAGVAFDESVSETIVLENKGFVDLKDVALSIVSQDGAPAPAWVHLNSAPDQGTIPVGEERKISISFNPTSGSVQEGMYTFYLRIASSNYETTDIGLYVSVTQSGIGNALFKVADIYTGTLDLDNEIIQGLAGAKIKVQNEEVLTIEQTLTTDSLGEALFMDLPAGRYKYRITADNHQEHIGRLWIKPGITVNEEIFLGSNLVTVEWEVVETTIEDKYEIVLNATYETDVPAAVVIVEPMSIMLPKMNRGDVYYGEFTLTNYGLIRAKELNFSLPEDDENFKYELLTGLPDSIEAKKQITVPYKVTCLNSPDQKESQGTGGGWVPYMSSAHICYVFECMYEHGGDHWEEKKCIWIIFHYGSPSGFGSPIPADRWALIQEHLGDTPWFVQVGALAAWPDTIEGVVCWPISARWEVYWSYVWEDEKTREEIPKEAETKQDAIKKVGCTVNTVLREFNDDAIDLSVKVPGGTVAVKRLFYGNEWHWEHLRNNLSFNYDSLGEDIESIDKGGVVYERSVKTASPVLVYEHDTYRIKKEDSSYLWEDKSGNWKEYDLGGRMTSYGTRTGIVGKLLYEEGENRRLIGVGDRNDRQVVWFEYNADDQISAVWDNDNRRVEYTYTDARLSNVIDVLGNETIYEYDGKGRIIRTVDAAGRPTIASYDDYGNVAKVVDRQGVGHFFQFDYDEVKKEYYAQIKTSSGMIEEVWYDRNGETKRVDFNGRTIKTIVKDGRDLIITDEKGNITRKEFDEWDNLTATVYPDGSSVSFEYEHTFSQVTREADSRGNVTEYEYDDQGNMIRKTEAIGTTSERVTTYTYNELCQLLKATIEGDANTEAASTIFSYDDNENLALITDPEGNKTEFLKYNNMGNMLKMKDPRGHIWEFVYDDMGRLISKTDPLGNTTAYEYDGANNQTAIINAYLKHFDFEYDDHNNQIKATDPYGKYISTTYNTDNLPVQIIDQEGKESLFEYDNEGRLIKSIDGAGNQTIYYYDESKETVVLSDRPVKIDYPTYTRKLYYDKLQRVILENDILDENTDYSTNYIYDTAGNVISETDEGGKTTTYEYDALNRLVKIIDSLSGVTERSYDDRDNLISLKDQKGGITRFEYDRSNRMVKRIRSMGEETIYEYDASGNWTTVLDAKGQKIVYEYDALNRLIKIRYFAKDDHENPVKIVEFTYDKLGNLLSYNDGTTSATYNYDDLERKTGKTINYGPFSLSYSYIYFANDLKKSFTGPNGITYDYTYDAENRLRNIGIPGQGQITYNTYQWNSPSKITLPGGTTAEYTYNPLMQVKSISMKDPAQNILMAYNYQYSPAGNITAKGTEHGNYTYQYDQLYRLIEATNLTVSNESYTYDAIGNRLTAEGVEGNWNYNDNSQLLGYNNVSYEYDDNGNMIRKIVGDQLSNYIYNIENRLLRVEDGEEPVIVEYYYDPFGRRLWKDVGGFRTYYFYSEEGFIGEYDANGNEIKSYGYAPDSMWTTYPLFQRLGGVYYWYQNDHLGTSQKIIDTSGKIVWDAIYDSFGNCQITLAEIENNLRFPGQYHDVETDLYYNWNRYYDPIVGRYLSPDPIGFRSGINLYTYVTNNPLKWVDSLGLCNNLYLYPEKPEWWPESASWPPSGWEFYNLDFWNTINQDPKYKKETEEWVNRLLREWEYGIWTTEPSWELFDATPQDSDTWWYRRYWEMPQTEAERREEMQEQFIDELYYSIP